MSAVNSFKDDLSTIKNSFATKLNYVQEQWQDNVATSFFSLIESETGELELNLLRALEEYLNVSGKLYKKILEFQNDHQVF